MVALRKSARQKAAVRSFFEVTKHNSSAAQSGDKGGDMPAC
jgi:hypothetical protein